MEVQQQPMLPKWVLRTSYGLEHVKEFDPRQENSARRDSQYPQHASGTVEMHHPLFSSQRRTAHIVNGQDVSEELPWCLVPIDRGECLGALPTPLTLDEVGGRPGKQYNAAIANRHVPSSLEYYYFEADLDPTSDYVLGLVQFPTRAAKKDECAPAPPAASDSGGRRRRRSSRNNNHTVVDSVPIPEGFGSVDAELERQRDQILGRAWRALAAEEGMNIDSEDDEAMVEELSISAADDDDDDNDGNGGDVSLANIALFARDGADDYLNENDHYETDNSEVFERRESEDEVEEYNDMGEYIGRNEEDEILEETSEESSDESEGANRGGAGAGTARPSETYDPTGMSLASDTIFPASEAVYDRRPARGVDDLWLRRTNTGQLVDTVLWNPIEELGPGERPTRAGIIVDRVNNSLSYVLNGKVKREIRPWQPRPELGGLFPMVLVRSGKCRVRFGDGRQFNDGFMFGIQDYIRGSLQTMLLEARNRLTPPKDNEATNEQDDSYLRVGSSTGENSLVAPCNEVIRQYMEFYGYAGGPAKDIREAVARYDFGAVRSLLSGLLVPADTQFMLDLHEFVALARSGSPDALAFGRELAERELTAKQAEQLKLASAILVTHEPRPPSLAHFYSPEAQTDLLRALLAVVQPQRPELQSFVENLAAAPDSGRKTATLTALTALGDGRLWKW